MFVYSPNEETKSPLPSSLSFNVANMFSLRCFIDENHTESVTREREMRSFGFAYTTAASKTRSCGGRRQDGRWYFWTRKLTSGHRRTSCLELRSKNLRHRRKRWAGRRFYVRATSPVQLDPRAPRSKEVERGGSPMCASVLA